MGLGLKTQIDPQEPRVIAAQGVVVHGSDRGTVRAFWYDTLQPNLRRIVTTAGAIMAPPTLGGLNAIATQSPAGGAMAGGIAAVVGAAGYGVHRAVQSFHRRGTELSITLRPELFTAMKANPAEKEYFQAMTGMDLDSLQVNPTTNLIEKIPGRIAVETTRNANTVRDEIRQGITALRSLYADIGLPLKSLESTPADVILRNTLTTTGFQQSEARWEKTIIDQFDANRSGVRDIWNNTADSPLFCVGPLGLAMPGATPDYDNLDTIGNLRRFRKAEQDVYVKKAVESIGVLMKGDPSRDGIGLESVKAIRSSIATKKDGQETNTAAGNRAKEARKKIEALDTTKTETAGKKTPLKVFATTQEAPKKIERTLREEFKLTIITDIPTTIDTEITRLKDELNTAYNGGDSLSKQHTEARRNWLDVYKTEFEDVSRRRAAALGTTTGSVDNADVKAIATERANLQHPEKDQLSKEIKDRDDRIQKLTELKDASQEAIKTQQETESATLENLPKELSETQKAYDDLVAPAGGAPTITPAELGSKTFDELVVLATNPPYSISNTTPEEKAELRKTILRAKSEHEARQIEIYDISPVVQVDVYNQIVNPAVGGGTLNANDLFTMSDAQLTNLLHNPPYRWSTDPAFTTSNLEALQHAQTEARKKLRIRYQTSLDVQIKDLDQQIEVQNKIVKSADETTENTKGIIELTDRLLNPTRQGEIFTKAVQIPDSIATFTDSVDIGATNNTYSEQERTVNAPRGYYETLNLLFNYQDTPNRGAEFQKLHKVFPPEQLAERMHNAFNLGLTAPFTMKDALDQINGHIAVTRNISYPQLYTGFRDMINQLANEVNAL